MAERQAGEVVKNGDTVAAGCVALEWVGEKSPTEDPRVEYALLRGLFSEEQRKVLDAAIAQTIRRIDGKRSRDLGPCAALPHLSRRYQWGPKKGTYVVAVTFKDAEAILACRSGHEFRDVTEGVPVEPLRLPVRESIRIVKREAFRSVAEFRRATA